MGNNYNQQGIGYVICPTDQLRKILLKKDLLRHATMEQCSRIFEMNAIERCSKMGHYASLHELISMIWLCSDQSRDEIARLLIEANNRYIISISDKNTVGGEVVA